MVYALIAVVMIIIIVPIFNLLPSARQKEQMAIRMAARAAGVVVELTSIDDPNPKQDKYVSHIGKALPAVLKVAAYRLQRKRPSDWRRRPVANWCMQKDLDGNWHWAAPPHESIDPALLDWIETEVTMLPADVQQVEEDTFTITIYWHEREKGSQDKVFDFLKACAAMPLFRSAANGSIEDS